MNTTNQRRSFGKIIFRFLRDIESFLSKKAFLISLLFFLLDKLIKVLFYSVLKYKSFFVQNKGISFGLLPNLPWIFINSVVLIVLLVFFFVFHNKPLLYVFFGGLGNILDRLLFGAVIDYLPFFFTRVNLNDVIITIGMIVFTIDLLFIRH